MSRCKTCLFALALIVCATPSLAGHLVAGTLANETSAYFDGVTDWHGSTLYNSLTQGNGGDVVGTIEWAVYAPGTFPAGFLGYTPSSSNLVYAYQIFQTGTDALSSFTLSLFGPASNGGTFSGGGVSGLSPLTTTVTPSTSVMWTFAGIGPGQTSLGLAFESPNVPTNSFSTVVDAGFFSNMFPIPGTSTTPIPEPATITLAFVGLMGLVGVWLRRRRRR